MEQKRIRTLKKLIKDNGNPTNLAKILDIKSQALYYWLNGASIPFWRAIQFSVISDYKYLPSDFLNDKQKKDEKKWFDIIDAILKQHR